jgi:hypothetical protein
MSLARLLLLAGNVALALLVFGSEESGIGRPRWHHDAAYLALSVVTVAAWPLLRRRKLTTLLLASLGAWCVLTGVWLVYVTPSRGDGRWMSWWHGATSVAFALAFLAHWARNNARLAQLARRAAAHPATLAVVALGWAGFALAAAATWALPERALRNRFSDRYLDDVTTVAFALALAGLLLGATALRRRVRVSTLERNRARGAVDASLLAMTWLATLSGFPLLYLGRHLRALDAYWLVTAWHVVAGALLVGLVAAHVAFNARPLAAHAR